ncbi:MAG: hypothetical protein ETSY1_32305 [Candidatus Entotheonella factor]|uniref:Nucleotide-diphospho-sugar transferase domain-containing protein n=1 Tax=Entotheonella factor TaxID=1429438 RepID=W4LAS4_ENTF1|nr:MAG: hypothetical protein ETSY1_32305 [Candidatus Entotheonella factor]
MPSSSQKIAVLSADTTGIYAALTPLTAYLWNALIDYVPFVYFVGEIDSFIVDKTLEAGAHVRHWPEIPQGFTSSQLAQNLRLFAALEEGMTHDAYLLISDADMWPLSYAYFNCRQDQAKRLHLFNAYGTDLNEAEYPMCYIGARSVVWKEILNSHNIYDSQGIRDQIFISKLIKQWPHFSTHVQKMSRPLDPSINGFHCYYTDRIDRAAWRDYRDGDVDAHLPQTGDKKDWIKLKRLLEQLHMHNSWTEDYINKVSGM